MQTRLDAHVGEDTLERYGMGQLADELIPPLEEHLLLCDVCRAHLVEVEQYLRIGAAAAREIRNEERLSQPFWRWLERLGSVPKPVWAGALAAILMIVAIPRITHRENVATTDVFLEASRGGLQNAAQAQPGKVILNINSTELPSTAIRIQLVDSDGAEVWTGNVKPAPGQMRVVVPKALRAGNYWVRLYGPDGATLREFGLEVR